MLEGHDIARAEVYTRMRVSTIPRAVFEGLIATRLAF